jgi:hypothetical protein
LNKGLLVTTSFSFLRLDPETGGLSCLHRGEGLYYGIARSTDRIFVAARRRLVSSDFPTDREHGVILVFDHGLRHINTITAPFPLRDMHEIKWRQGCLWVACSFDNMVAIFDGKTWRQWYPLGEPGEGERDRNHFNSFMFEKDRVWVLAHNKGDSALLAFDVKTRRQIEKINLGVQAHNIWCKQRELFTCSSGDGRIVGSKGFCLETGGFPRGVARLNHRHYVGVSELAERKNRDFTSGFILVYSEGWRLEKRLDLPGEGLILDLAPAESPQGLRKTTYFLTNILKGVKRLTQA